MYVFGGLGIALLLVLICISSWLYHASRYGWRDDYTSLFAQSRANLSELQAIMFFVHFLASIGWTLFLIFELKPGPIADVLVGCSCSLTVVLLQLAIWRIRHSRLWLRLVRHRHGGSLSQVESEGKLRAHG